MLFYRIALLLHNYSSPLNFAFCKRRYANPITYISFLGTAVTSIAMVDRFYEPALETPPSAISQFPTTHSEEQAWFCVFATFSAVVPGVLLLLRLYTKLRVVREVDVTDCSRFPSIFEASILTKI